jgi:hypothetical protein
MLQYLLLFTIKYNKMLLGNLMEWGLRIEDIALLCFRQCKDEQAFVPKVPDYTAKLKILKEAMDQLITHCKARIWIIVIIFQDFSLVLPVVLYKY